MTHPPVYLLAHDWGEVCDNLYGILVPPPDALPLPILKERFVAAYELADPPAPAWGRDQAWWDAQAARQRRAEQRLVSEGLLAMADGPYWGKAFAAWLARDHGFRRLDETMVVHEWDDL